MGKGNRQIHATAYHEASHVVIGMESGFRAGKRGVSVIPHEESSGRVHMPLALGGHPDFDDSARITGKIERRAIFLLAGMEAQRRFNRRSVRGYHASSDYRNVIDLLSYVYPVPSDLFSAHVNYLTVPTKFMLERPVIWAQVVGIAEALVSRKVLSDEEIHTLIWKAKKTA